jgi:hypothetical protein
MPTKGIFYMFTLKVSAKSLNNDNGGGGLEIIIPGATGNPEDGDLNCPVFIEHYHGELRVIIWDGSPEPTIVPIKNYNPSSAKQPDGMELTSSQPKEGSTKKPVAICGICGKDDKDGTGEGGLCKHCGGDHWVELGDFDGPTLIDYIQAATIRLKTTVEELHVRILNLNQGV